MLKLTARDIPVHAGSRVKTSHILSLVAITLLSSSFAFADDDVEERVGRLEQVINNRQQLDIVNRLNDLQQQVEILRGDIEVQKQASEQLTQRQHLLFQDLDNRLAAIEKGGKPASTAATIVKPPVAATTPATPSTLITPQSAAQANTTTNNTAPVGAATTTAPVAAIPVVAPTPQQDQAAYQQAYQNLLDKQYPKAVESFNNYLRDYPQGRYRPNAYYWLGEVYLIQNQPNDAQQAFNTVIKDYPQNTKVGDAMLKLGFAYAQMGDITQAKATLTQVTQKYPNSAIAGLAQSRLAELP